MQSVLAVLREDWVTHGRSWHRPGLHAVAVYRLGAWQRGLPRLLRYPIGMAYGILKALVTVYGVELSPEAKIGRRFFIVHHSGVVVSRLAEIGDDCSLENGVTIGTASDGRGPKIGNGVEIATGAVITSGARVGDRAMIGPKAIVVGDVPARGRAVAESAAVLGARQDATAPGESRRLHRALRPATRSLEGVIDVIKSKLGLADPIEPDTPLLSSGLVDSFSAIALLHVLEDAYGVTIPSEEVGFENFDTPEDILATVERHHS